MSVLALVLHGGYTPPPGIVSIRHKAIWEDSNPQHMGTIESKMERIEVIYQLIEDGVNTIIDLTDELGCAAATTKDAVKYLLDEGRIEREFFGRHHVFRALGKGVVSKTSGMDGNKRREYNCQSKYRYAMSGGPCSAQDIAKQLGFHICAVYKYLKKLHTKELIEECEEKAGLAGCKPITLWRWIGE